MSAYERLFKLRVSEGTLPGAQFGVRLGEVSVGEGSTVLSLPPGSEIPIVQAKGSGHNRCTR